MRRKRPPPYRWKTIERDIESGLRALNRAQQELDKACTEFRYCQTVMDECLTKYKEYIHFNETLRGPKIHHRPLSTQYPHEVQDESSS